MNSLFKASQVLLRSERMTIPSPAGHSVDPTSVHPLPDESASDIHPSRIDDLEAELARLNQSIKSREKAEYERGLIAGRMKAIADIQSDQSQQFELLRVAMTHASARLDDQLEKIESLSIDLAEAALQRILGDTSNHAQLIGQTIKNHLKDLAADTILSIQVSETDFPGEDNLRALTADLPARLRHCVEVISGAPHGTCLITLTLGKIDISLTSQGLRLSDAFSRLRTHD